MSTIRLIIANRHEKRNRLKPSRMLAIQRYTLHDPIRRHR